jgi:transposase InsO family protein
LFILTPEFTAEAFVEWCTAQRFGIGYIQPGKPDQNAFIERFNRTFLEEVLDAYLFDSLECDTSGKCTVPSDADSRSQLCCRSCCRAEPSNRAAVA